MGYCIDQRDTRFFIPHSRINEAYAALNTLAAAADSARYGHFAWVDTATIRRARSLTEHLKEWRWEAEFDAQGNLTGLHFTGEKLGDDFELFQALAPFVRSGSFIVMQGEDGEMWRWMFDGSQCHEQSATVSFGPVAGDIVDIEARDVSPDAQKGRLLPEPPRRLGR